MERRKKRVKVHFIGFRTVSLFVLAILLFTGIGAEAGDTKYPTGAVTIINPLRPGGGTDIELRNLVPFLQKYLGQPVVVQGKPGAATTIGASAAAHAKPDGYTLLGIPLTDGILAQEFHDTDYNLAKFEQVYGWFEGPMNVIVNAKSPFKSLSDLIEEGKKRPLKAALAGIGGIDHLHSLLLEKHTGMKKAVKIPYGGGGPAVGSVIKGEVDFFTCLSTTSVRFVKAGKVRELVILGPKSLEALPETPTIYDLGYKDWPYVSFIRGIVAPPGTPKEIVAILEGAFKKAVDDPEFRALMKKQSRPVKPFSSNEMEKAAQDVMKVSKTYTPFMKEASKKK